MTAIDIVATNIASATPVAGLLEGLDINDNGTLGWPDGLAWLFFATVGLFGVAVVAGMAFAAVTAMSDAVVRIGRAARGGRQRRRRPRG